jgi:hypothetical protein
MDRLDTAVEKVAALQRLDRASRNAAVGFLGSPVVAWAWASTCEAARAFDAHPVFPQERHPVTVVYDVLWMAVYATWGMAGLHAVFGAILLATLALGAWGRIEIRSLDRRFGARALRDERLRNQLRGRPGTPEAPRGGSRTGGAAAAHGVVAVLRVAIRVAPLALGAATLAFAVKALRT